MDGCIATVERCKYKSFWLPLTRELSSETRLRERKGKVIMYLNPFSPSVTAYAVPPSRLPPRSVLLLCRGVHRTPAPSSAEG